MKNLTGKEYVIAVGVSAGVSLALMLLILLFSLISWSLVWAVFTFALIPLGGWIVRLWKDTNCTDVDDLLSELIDIFEGKNEEKTESSIEW